MKEGYHVFEESVVDEEGIEEHEKISFIKFLKLLKNKNFKKFTDYTVIGLETLVPNMEDEKRFLKYVKVLLTERSPYMTGTGNVFNFKIDGSKANIEIWSDKPVLKYKDGGKTDLYEIFGSMEMYEDNPNWFWQQLNIES